MKSRTIYIMLGIFIALIVVATAPLWKGDSSGNESSSSGKTSIKLSDYTEESTKQVTIKAPGRDMITLKKEAGDWLADGKPADAKAVTALFKAMSKAKTEELVSRNEDNHAGFGVAKDSSTLLTIDADGKTTKYVIGNAGETANTFYVRRENEKNVYLAKGTLQTEVSKDLEDWRPQDQKEKKSKGK